ncbi:MAG: hypothetical protein COA96_03060 [SAR86 cluster bacterium]|uniref:Uncharacterized protein n=1 Tax=SAR86 cluster bacterium TaxID=2030880 RepID=A0A2A5B7G8_9GAMM|nr:MAG: hypothetical protein COA96_03060 [SAR86 cluster bacterium]
MKTTLSCLLAVLLLAYNAAGIANPQHGFFNHGEPTTTEEPATFSMRENDRALCGTPFWDDLYALTVNVFSVGASKVKLHDYEEQIFSLVRSSEEFGGSAGAFIEHIKEIPAQLVQIIIEDSAVLDSCANFSVAMVGPP